MVRWQPLAALVCLLSGGAAAYRVDDAMADHTAAAIDFAEAGDMASAVASFRAAAAFTPDVPEHWYNLAEALADEDWEGSTAAAARKEAAAARATHAELEAEAAGGTLRRGLVEEVLWDAKTSVEAPAFPAADILLPEEVSKITRTKWKPPVGHADYDANCGWSEWVTAWDTNGDPLLTSIDRFFTEDVAAALRRDGIGSKWEVADIHPDNKVKDDPRKGNGFPGLRVDAAAAAKTQTQTCLAPILELVNPAFPALPDAALVQTLYGLVDKKLQPGGIWLDSQRLPHNDIKWDLGVLPGGAVPGSYASVYALTRDFNTSGTGLFLEKESGFSLLKTLPMNERAQGNFNPHHEGRQHPELDLLEEIPDPHPHQMKHMRDNAWVKMIMVSYLRYNRFVLYDGRRLHNQYLEPEDYPRLSADPAKGRLTMNSFFWARGSH
jgi:hypothetical protein